MTNILGALFPFGTGIICVYIVYELYIIPLRTKKILNSLSNLSDQTDGSIFIIQGMLHNNTVIALYSEREKVIRYFKYIPKDFPKDLVEVGRSFIFRVHYKDGKADFYFQALFRMAVREHGGLLC
ncbi:MAG TPA: hypothetical protein VLB02_02465 [Candidatus Paceibacterota bacterium]|nr:hypothetical protein [Candidatus Paceibacterota bacterium]